MNFYLILLALVAGQAKMLGALEKAGPEHQRAKQTSAVKEISLKPLFVYSARGRRDPFVFDLSLPQDSAAAGRDFSISSLKLVGFLGTQGSNTAIFRNAYSNRTYRFNGGKLFSPEGIPIENIKGGILPDRQVTLNQGESTILFRLPGNPKLKSLDATIAHDRKEQQR